MPSPPHGIPRQRAPSAPAASSSRSDLRRHRALQRLPVERPAEEVDGEHRLRPRRDRLVDPLEIEVERLRVDVDEHRRRAREPHDVRRRREGVGGDDHLVAFARSRARAPRDGAPPSRRDGDGVLDPAGLPRRAPRAPAPSGPSSAARLEHLAHGLGQLRLARRPGTARRMRGSVLLAVPRDRPLEAVVELDLRLEAEHLARLLDVRDPQLDVGVVERLEDDLDLGAGEPLDPLGEVVDRDRRARVADVERLPDGVRALEAARASRRPCRRRSTRRGSASRRRGSSGRGPRARPR